MEFPTQAIRDEAQCKGSIRGLNIRETETQFVYRGIRGTVVTQKGDDRAGAYLHFLAELQKQFNPDHIYHVTAHSRYDVPKLDREMAEEFLSIIDNATQALENVG